MKVNIRSEILCARGESEERTKKDVKLFKRRISLILRAKTVMCAIDDFHLI